MPRRPCSLGARDERECCMCASVCWLVSGGFDTYQEYLQFDTRICNEFEGPSLGGNLSLRNIADVRRSPA